MVYALKDNIKRQYKREYKNEYVAIKGRKVLDSDTKLEILVKRVYLRNYDESIAIE